MFQIGLFNLSSHLTSPSEIFASDYQRQLVEFDSTGHNSNEVVFTATADWGRVNYIKVFDSDTSQVVCAGQVSEVNIDSGESLNIPVGYISIPSCNNLSQPTPDFNGDFIQVISTPITSIVIEHNLSKFPNVIAIDELNKPNIVDIFYLNFNSLRIETTVPFTGMIICN